LLDHGLDPLSLGLVLLTYGVVMREPPWLVVTSTATVASLQFLTFLHGYRIGYVILGEVGIIEGIAVAAVVCLAAAGGADQWLTTPLWLGVAPASLLAIAVVAGALPAFVSMRGLLAHRRDVIPLAALEALALGWFASGNVGTMAGGALVLAIAFLQSMIVTTARLGRCRLRLADLPLTVGLAAATTASLLFDRGGSWQRLAAAALVLYSAGRAARLFLQAATGQRSLARVL
jgi:hypothetical protein